MIPRSSQFALTLWLVMVWLFGVGFAARMKDNRTASRNTQRPLCLRVVSRQIHGFRRLSQNGPHAYTHITAGLEKWQFVNTPNVIYTIRTLVAGTYAHSVRHPLGPL
jgi:hypothetical protein